MCLPVTRWAHHCDASRRKWNLAIWEALLNFPFFCVDFTGLDKCLCLTWVFSKVTVSHQVFQLSVCLTMITNYVISHQTIAARRQEQSSKGKLNWFKGCNALILCLNGALSVDRSQRGPNVTPLPVDPAGPYSRRTLGGSERREAWTVPRIHMWCLSI